MPEDPPAPASLPRPAPGEQSANHSPVPLPTPTTSRKPLEPVPRRVIAIVAASIATATTGLVVVLWWAGTAGLSGAELVNARFNALRTGLSIGVGGGGIFALYLAWRRQHATEIGLVQKERDQADVARAYELQRETAEHARQHAERVAAATERDAEARRITDLYAKSVEQLGSDKTPVRHGGLYALERLAQDHPALRQTVVNVLCAYLRVPFDPPGDSPDADTDPTIRNDHGERVQEREVRLTAQRILTTHLNSGDNVASPAATFWDNIDLDLTGATLIDWEMSNCTSRSVSFRRATFVGNSSFSKSAFTADARFTEAIFIHSAIFDGAMFSGDAWFNRATFTGSTWFDKAQFTKMAHFKESIFKSRSWFSKALFKHAWFNKVTFADEAWFNEATFTEDARFYEAMFADDARFDRAIFARDVQFTGSTFTKNANFHEVTFMRDVNFQKVAFVGENRFSEATLRVSPGRSLFEFLSWWPTGWQPSSDHAIIEGREGTWHRFLEVQTMLDPSNDPPTELTGD